MSELVGFLNAISWPIVALIVAVMAAFGWFEKPIKTVSESFASLFREIRRLRDDLEKIPESLQKLQDIVSSDSGKLMHTIESLQSEMNEKIMELEKVVADAQERLKQATINEADELDGASIAHYTSATQANTPIFTIDEARSEIEKLVLTWNKVRHQVEQRYPAAAAFDKREFGQAIRAFAYGADENKPSINTAEKISDLHSKFKSVTRMKAYADAWLTKEIISQFTELARTIEADLAA